MLSVVQDKRKPPSNAEKEPAKDSTPPAQTSKPSKPSTPAARYYVPLEVSLTRTLFGVAALLQFIVILLDRLREYSVAPRLRLLAALAFLAAAWLLPKEAPTGSLKRRRDGILLLSGLGLMLGLGLLRLRFELLGLATVVAPSVAALWWLSSPAVTRWFQGQISIREVETGLARNRRLSPRLEGLATHGILLLAVIITMLPVLWVVDTALSQGNSLSSGDAFNPADWTGEHFSNVLGGEDFYLWLRNSLVVSIGTTLFGLALAVPAGYGFSRYRFKAHNPAMFSFLLVQMFPGVIIIVPYFILMKTLGLLNSAPGLILAYTVTALPLCVWMLKGFFDTVPRELEEAALLDGCSQAQVFSRIILPLSLPAIAVTALFSFLAAWNEFLLALTFNTSNDRYTLPVGLASFISPTKQLWGDFAAMALIVSLPVVILFILFQRYLIQGLTAGSVKG